MNEEQTSEGQEIAQNSPSAHLYDLLAEEISFSVLFRKAGRELPLNIILSPIPEDELIRYERAVQRPYAVNRDGSTETDVSDRRDVESELFDAHFLRMGGGFSNNGDRDAALTKIPSLVKQAVIRNAIGGVDPVTVRETVSSFDDLLDNRVAITTEANNRTYKLTHVMKEPTAEDELEYRRATGGKLRTLPGRRKTEVMVVEDFTVYPRLYERLVESVEGYSMNGSPVDPSDKKIIAKHMPYIHKKVVVRQLFGQVDVGQDSRQEDTLYPSGDNSLGEA